MYLHNVLIRTRFILDRGVHQDIILKGKDFDISDKFCRDHKLPEGHGLGVIVSYIINYYLNEVKK